MPDDVDALILREATDLVETLKKREIPLAVATEIVAFALSIYLSYWCDTFGDAEPVEACLRDVVSNTANLLEICRSDKHMQDALMSAPP